MTEVGLTYPDLGGTGLFPFPVQQPIKHLGEVSGVNSPDSPFGPDPAPERTFGYELVYTLRGIDEAVLTFHKTGFYDNQIIRRTVLGLPVPAERVGPQDFIDYAEDNLQLVGAFGPHVGEVTADLDTKRVYLSSGATDIVVHADVRTYEKLAWRVPTMEEIRQARDNGSWLEMRNPGAPRVVPMNRQFITGPISEVARIVFKQMNVDDWNKLLNGDITGAVNAAYDKADQVVLPDGMVQISRRLGSKRQLTFLFNLIAHCLDLSKEIKHFRELQEGVQPVDPPAHLKDVTTPIDMVRKLTARVADAAGAVSDYHQHRQSKYVGTSLTKAQKGLTAHVHLNR